MVDEWRELCVRAEEEISELIRLPLLGIHPRDTDDLPDLIRDLREALTALPEEEVTQ